MATIIVDSNSYVTVAEATAYFDDRFGFDKWNDVTDKEKVLISATQLLDSLCKWEGLLVDPAQLLAFPRLPVGNPTPKAIKDAQCEIAYKIIDTGSTSTDGGDGLKSLKAGSVQLDFKASTPDNPLINDLVRSLIAPYSFGCKSGDTRVISVFRM
jgi:hypothetical protein